MGRIKDKIMRKIGFENIKNIKITWDFFRTKPKAWKMNVRRNFYDTYNEFYVPIVVDSRNVLIDGYTSYLIAEEKGIKYVPVERV